MRLFRRPDSIILAAGICCACIALGAALALLVTTDRASHPDLLVAGIVFLVLCCGVLAWGLRRRLEERHGIADKLHRLAAASAEIFALGSREQLLSRVAHLACELTGGEVAIVALQNENNGEMVRRLAHGRRAGRNVPLLDDATIEGLLDTQTGAFSLTRREAERRFAQDGRAIAVNLAAAPLLDHAGRRIGFICLLRKDRGEFTAQDLAVVSQLAQMVASAAEIIQIIEGRTIAVAAARAAQEGAERARLEISRIFESMSDAFCALDREGRFTYTNRQCEILLNRSKEDILGKSILEAFPHVAGDSILQAFDRALHQREQVEVEYYSPFYEKWFELRMFPHGRGIAVYFRDITARIQTQETLRQAQKMEVVGQLTGGLAHDFNNLLTVILGNLDVLDLALQDRPDLHELVKTAGLAGDRAAELISRLLAFARRQALAPQAVDVNGLITGLEGLMRHAMGDLVQYSFAGAKDLPLALIDPSQLESALLNLAINARDAMPEGGRLRIETAFARIDHDYAERQIDVRSGDYIKVTVSDTGHGMPAEVAGRAFEPFFTTKPVGRGSGLGLSMIFGFLKQSGGHVQLDSEVGRGTSVMLYLPRASAQAGQVELSMAEQINASPASGESILLVDHDGLARPFAETTLRALGYGVTAAGDGAEALAMLEAGGNHDLLITDLELDDAPNGHDLVREVRARCPSIRVIYLVRDGEGVLASQVRIDPHATILQKPFRRAELAHAVEVALGNRGG